MSINSNEMMRDTPTIPGGLYENLPSLLKEICEQFVDGREKDIILTSSLVILSGCFTSVKGKYNTDWLSTNLFGFIVAPPASGKSVMKYASVMLIIN